ncbi:MAG: hypothetical protein PUF72_05415 [Clostridiales bacterium]|nr:hypothetical protein [Clostridiales bacterium]
MRELDITKQTICCCDEFDTSTYDGKTVNIPYELWFEVDKYFGTDTKGTDSCLDFYTFYHEDGSVTAIYVVKGPDHTHTVDWELTKKEEIFFKEKMEEYCRCKCGCTLSELWKELWQ